jgi:hypothetical protein
MWLTQGHYNLCIFQRHPLYIDINMDFITKSKGKEVMFVVVDKFRKYMHFMALSHPYTAISVAKSLWIQFTNFMVSLPP